MTIGEKIKQKRQELKFTQEDIAEKIHVSRQTISSWENSKSLPDVTSLILLSDIYGVSLDELIKGDSMMINNIEKNEELAKESIELKRNRVVTGISIIGAVVVYVVENLTSIDTYSLVPILLLVALLASSIPTQLLTEQTKENKLRIKSLLIKKGVFISIGVIVGFLLAFIFSNFI